jgi:hypothetical protein
MNEKKKVKKSNSLSDGESPTTRSKEQKASETLFYPQPQSNDHDLYQI